MRCWRLRPNAARGKRSFERLHPVLPSHPETGRKSIFVDAPHSVGFEAMSEEKSESWSAVPGLSDGRTSYRSYTRSWVSVGGLGITAIPTDHLGYNDLPQPFLP